ncbi:uncharacterized protein LOC105702367 [Orussus abietinus]|uniref:uncharacterized protein LOC105702367 n=1 Tax=Orussus abietinus TaxID=222816 RepID=UPI000625D091|nr:uncharacterized protein LOC105702367 [Orussus abietinus]
MVAMLRPREIEVDEPSHTEKLAKWISTVRQKKAVCIRNRKRNLRMEAVLAHALSKAESELRNKQLSRIKRWQQLKRKLSKELDFYSKDSSHRSNDCKEGLDPWRDSLCPELHSFDSFMAKINEIKVPLQR